MRIRELRVQPNWVLSVVADDGRIGRFDVRPYLRYEAFEALRDQSEFVKVANGGYFIEWDCGADLSADTIEARWQVVGKQPRRQPPRQRTPLSKPPATGSGPRTKRQHESSNKRMQPMRKKSAHG
ncbi:MAG: DUF2442 domain-containing protein [Nitrospira sp.]|nr:DUF2442 domain-containing protein [Nitrospira sp.]